MCVIVKKFCTEHQSYVECVLKICKASRNGQTCEASGKSEDQLRKTKKNVICDACADRLEVIEEEAQGNDNVSEIADTVSSKSRTAPVGAKRRRSSHGSSNSSMRSIKRRDLTSGQYFMAKMCGLIR